MPFGTFIPSCYMTGWSAYTVEHYDRFHSTHPKPFLHVIISLSISEKLLPIDSSWKITRQAPDQRSRWQFHIWRNLKMSRMKYGLKDPRQLRISRVLISFVAEDMVALLRADNLELYSTLLTQDIIYQPESNLPMFYSKRDLMRSSTLWKYV